MNSFRELRKEKNLTQFELAKCLEIDQTTVSKWELGKALPDTQTLIKLAEYFDVSTDYLLSRTKYYYPDKIKKDDFGARTVTAPSPMGDTRYSSEECEIIEKYRALPDKLKKMVREQLEVYSSPEELISKKDKKV